MNDQVINFFTDEMLAFAAQNKLNVAIWSTFFYTKLTEKGVYDFNRVKKWPKSNKLNPIDSYDKILVPINVGTIHWTLAIIQPKLKQITYYDSLSCFEGNEIMQNLIKWYGDQVWHESKITIEEGWRMQYASDLEQQDNGCDCGIFVIQFML